MMGSVVFDAIFLTLSLSLQFGMSHGDIQIYVTPEKCTSVIEDEVQISCQLDGVNDSGKEISAIELYKDAATPIVLLRDCSNISYEIGASIKVKAEGHISEDVAKSYLNAILSYPESRDTGVYTCVIYYFDEAGVMKEERANRSLLVEKPSVDDLGTTIGHMKAEMRKLKDDNLAMIEKYTNTTMQAIAENKENGSYVSSFHVTADSQFYTNSVRVLNLPQVILNTGDEYDEDTGIFSPRKAGLYAFNLNVRSQSTVYIELRVNDKSIGKVTCSYNEDWESASLSVVSKLWPGDHVKAMLVSGSSNFHSGRENVFSGYLIKLL